MQLICWFQIKMNLVEKQKVEVLDIQTDKTEIEKSDKKLLNEAKDFISRDEIELAIENMKFISITTRNEKIEIDTLGARYAAANRKNISGELSNTELTLEKNKIVNSLITLASMIDSRIE